MFALGHVWPHLVAFDVLPNSKQEVNKKSSSTLLGYLGQLGRVCTRRFLLYKPGLLTYSFFLAFLSIWSIFFVKISFSKYKKVTPKVNK
jgi:hypothetical protein